SVRSISNLERGVPHQPRTDTIQLLAEALELSAEERTALLSAARGMRRRRSTQASNHPSPQHLALPIPPTPLVGREREVAPVLALLGRDYPRLLTLCGLPGVGKTHLALEIARKAGARLPNGVLFVDLAPLRDFTLVGPTMVLRLGVRTAPGQSWQDALYAALRDQRRLLLLDNF